MADLIFELNKSKGTSLVLVTHDLTLAKRCDHLIELSGGKLKSNSQLEDGNLETDDA